MPIGASGTVVGGLVVVGGCGVVVVGEAVVIGGWVAVVVDCRVVEEGSAAGFSSSPQARSNIAAANHSNATLGGRWLNDGQLHMSNGSGGWLAAFPL
ncbi:MAG: hypothetical protein OXI56_12190 [bacterium]|nr:hypothetical protein [bacterium]MDE0602545.1 hypothetical protein [bacterium]